MSCVGKASDVLTDLRDLSSGEEDLRCGCFRAGLRKATSVKTRSVKCFARPAIQPYQLDGHSNRPYGEHRDADEYERYGARQSTNTWTTKTEVEASVGVTPKTTKCPGGAVISVCKLQISPGGVA